MTVKQLYEMMNDSERYGVQFGMFPMWAGTIMDEHGVKAHELMQYRKETERQDVNKEV